MSEERKGIFKKIGSTIGDIAEAAEDSKIPDVVKVLLRDTPFGKAGRMIEGLSEIFGVDDESAIADAMRDATPEQREKLAEFAAREVEALEATKQEALRKEQTEIEARTARHATDMLGDSLLNKIIRPVSLIVLMKSTLETYSIITFLFVIDYFVNKQLLEEFWENDLMKLVLMYQFASLSAALGFYFYQRRVEKTTSMEQATQLVLR